MAIQSDKIDRSPTGTGCSARITLLHAKGQLKKGDKMIGRSIVYKRNRMLSLVLKPYIPGLPELPNTAFIALILTPCVIDLQILGPRSVGRLGQVLAENKHAGQSDHTLSLYHISFISFVIYNKKVQWM